MIMTRCASLAHAHDILAPCVLSIPSQGHRRPIARYPCPARAQMARLTVLLLLVAFARADRVLKTIGELELAWER